MTPSEAIEIIDKAVQPNVSLNRVGYAMVQQAIEVLQALVSASKETNDSAS